MSRDAMSAEEVLGLVQRLQKEADDRRGRSESRFDVRPDTTVVLGQDPSPGANGGSATENSVVYVPPIPPARVSATQTLKILSAVMVQGWIRGAGSSSPPTPVGTGSLIDGGLGNFNGLIR